MNTPSSSVNVSKIFKTLRFLTEGLCDSCSAQVKVYLNLTAKCSQYMCISTPEGEAHDCKAFKRVVSKLPFYVVFVFVVIAEMWFQKDIY